MAIMMDRREHAWVHRDGCVQGRSEGAARRQPPGEPAGWQAMRAGCLSERSLICRSDKSVPLTLRTPSQRAPRVPAPEFGTPAPVRVLGSPTSTLTAQRRTPGPGRLPDATGKDCRELPLGRAGEQRHRDGVTVREKQEPQITSPDQCQQGGGGRQPKRPRRTTHCLRHPRAACSRDRHGGHAHGNGSELGPARKRMDYRVLLHAPKDGAPGKSELDGKKKQGGLEELNSCRSLICGYCVLLYG